MAEATTTRRGGPCAPRTAALAAITALAATMAVGCSSAPDTGAPLSGGGAKTVPVAAIAPSVPDRITIPGIGVDSTLGTVGLDSQGVMETPPMDKPMEADWYREGPSPGEKGAAAIVGHMDTPDTEKAVFYHLQELKKNEEIRVHREDGTTAVFSVDAVETFKKDSFPTDKVYSRTSTSELRLITCGGSLNSHRHWDSNVVVFAHLKGEAGA
ncbi:class F sortase [Streptomyces sp. NPDC051561]|uniref:class F sortase n=1 Tax=Streptomyces sp. NPDC051561 TaxID=3365658 RepID=UPI0037889C1D